MSDDFQQTVDLKIKKEEQKLKARAQAVSPGAAKNARGIDKVFQETKGEEAQNLKKIDKYHEPRFNENIIRRVVFYLTLILIGGIIYFMFFVGDNRKENQQASKWHEVRLKTGEIYYGEVKDIVADPVVIENIYFNYDQMKDGKVDPNFIEGKQPIRLAKRGGQSYGENPQMFVYQSNIDKLLLLDKSSDIINAITQYENKQKK